MSRRPGIATESASRGPHLVHMPSLCRAVAENSPIPTAELEGTTFVIRYANPAFCLFSKKTEGELTGSDFRSCGQSVDLCASLIAKVHRTAKAHSPTREEAATPAYSSCAAWPVMSEDNRILRVIVQVTETMPLHRQAIAMNQALLIGSVHQHELTEAAELLATRLQDEIAARKRAEQALIVSERLAAAGRMSAVLAHEINNPIAAVMDIVYLLKDLRGIPDPVPEYLDLADGELKRIAHITRQTLGFYSEMATPVTVRVCDLLDSVTDMLKAKIQAKNAVIEKQCDDVLEIAGMDGELRQVFSNFVLNSLHAIDENGRVTLRASISRSPANGNPRIRITVSDNGKGIAPSTLPQIFEPFFTTKGAVGNGLGLWVSKQIIDKHGGVLRVSSATQGSFRGTTFSVILPAGVA